MSKCEVRHFVCSLPGDANRDQIREVLRTIAVTWLDQHGVEARSVTWVHENGGMLEEEKGRGKQEVAAAAHLPFAFSFPLFGFPPFLPL